MTERERIITKVSYELHRQLSYESHSTVDDITRVALDTTLSEIVNRWSEMVDEGKTTNDLIAHVTQMSREPHQACLCRVQINPPSATGQTEVTGVDSSDCPVLAHHPSSPFTKGAQ